MKTSFLALLLGVTMLFSPLVAEAKARPSGICKDDTYTYAVHKQGACSWHKGIKTWFK